MREGILSAIGHTPLVSLSRVIKGIHFNLYGKLEALNPGGSMKDRPAISIINHAMETGVIRPGTVVVESSSGNMGIGLAQACLYFGLRFICVVDLKTTAQNILLLRAYGAEVDIVSEPDPGTGEFLQARINRVHYLLASLGNCFWPNQYSNIYNPIAHHETMREIVSSIGEVDYLFCATSTCGTMRGCAEYVKQHNMRTKVIAVDAKGSVIFGGCKAKRLIPGHGAAVRPQLYQDELASRIVYVSDLDCVTGCRRLVQREAILAGGSSGAIMMAIEKVKHDISPGSNCVAILPDRGERYLDTIYCDTWVREHFGDIAYLWEEEKEEQLCVMMTY